MSRDLGSGVVSGSSTSTLMEGHDDLIDDLWKFGCSFWFSTSTLMEGHDDLIDDLWKV